MSAVDKAREALLAAIDEQLPPFDAHQCIDNLIAAVRAECESESLDVDDILASTAEACRYAVADATDRLIIAFQRWCMNECIGRIPNEDDFRDVLRAALGEKQP